MGKKLQGAKLRAKKRAVAALEELQEQQAEAAAALTVTAAKDADLFVLDTTGETVPHHKRPSRIQSKFQRDAGLSAKEQKQVERLRERHDPAKLQELAERGRKHLEQQRRGRRTTQRTKTNFDLWNTNDDNSTKNISANVAKQAKNKPKNKTNKKPKLVAAAAVAAVAVDVAKTGQSYHPDPVAHKTLLDKAAAIEVARETKKRYLAEPLSKGMSEETKALLLRDSDTDESSDNDEDEQDDTLAVGPVPKRANKLTRAQLNKKKRKRVEEAIQQKQKKEKKLLKQVGEIHRYKKELNKQEQEKQALAKQPPKSTTTVAPGKDLEFQIAAKDVVHAPLVAVALDTAGSLRTLRPKGSLAQDRVRSLAVRQQIVVAGKDPESRRRTAATRKKRKLSTKGRHNSGAYYGDDCELLG